MNTETFTIDEKRLAKIGKLYEGAHNARSKQMCVMEAVAYVAGEPWSDHPECACPVIGAFMRSWNDSLSDPPRTELLKPLIPVLVGSKSTKEIENRRATMAADWLDRVYTPAWLRLAGLNERADALASFPEITSFAETPSIRPLLEAARTDACAAGAAAWHAAGAAAWHAAREAARAAAGAAAWAAAREAARAAAGAAAWDAAREAARAAAGEAAWAAAREAARAAAGEAARAKLEPTVKELQLSAVDLVKRMTALKADTPTPEPSR